MFTKALGWRRWNGYRSDLLRAARLAGDELAAWAGVEASYRLAVDFKGGLAERSEDLSALEDLQADELARLEDLTIVVEPNRDTWYEMRREASARGEDEPPELISAMVRLRLWSVSGLRFEVEGPARTNVEGLAQRIGEILKKGAPPLHRLDMGNVAFWLVSPLAIAGALLAVRVPRWLGVAERNGEWEAGEVVGICIATVAVVVIPLALWRAFPTVELLDDGQLPKYRRLRRVVIGVSGSLALVLVGLLLDRAFN